MKVSTRADWNCPPASVQPLPYPSGVSIHYPGPGRFRFDSHSRCLTQVRSWDAMHRARGSRMLEYGGLVCQHGYYIEGRGTWGNLKIRPGSNGTSYANERYASVQFMMGTLDAPPSDAEYRWMGEVVARAVSQGIPLRVIGHRDTYSTACPGDPIYNNLGKIRNYAANPGTPPPIEEDDMTPEQDAILRELRQTLTVVYDTLTPGQEGVKFDGEVYRQVVQGYESTLRHFITEQTVALQGEIAGLKAAIEGIALGSGADPEAIKAAVERAVQDAMLGMNIVAGFQRGENGVEAPKA